VSGVVLRCLNEWETCWGFSADVILTAESDLIHREHICFLPYSKLDLLNMCTNIFKGILRQ
jgi:hypothetical protein